MFRIVSAFIISFLLLAPSAAEPVPGPVVLTVSGQITNPNRGPWDEFMDAFFGSHDVEFEKAAEFDINALEALGMKALNVSYPEWPRKFTFEGPLLSDVLKAAGANGSSMVVRALDGYAPEIPMADLEKYPVILALKADGRYLGLGNRGPAWLIYPRNDYPELAEEDDGKFVWSVYSIEVQ